MSETPTHDTDGEPNGERPEDREAASSLRRRNFLKGLAITGGIASVGGEVLSDRTAATATTTESGWEMQPPQLETPWTAEVSPDNAHPEYPRPQLVRDEWANLNGVWQFTGASEGESPPIGQDLDERILVPYPVESALSGIKRHETWMWYRRQFTVPDEWLIPTAHSGGEVERNPNAQRLLLHFERVDWEATVYVNGEKVTRHQGGYDHFVADVTDALVQGGPQELVVGVFDPTGYNTEPRGTQPKGRQGVGTGVKGDDNIDMTPTSGIWDTVWLEPVPDPHVTGLDMTPDVENGALRLTVEADTDGATAVATAYDADEKVGCVAGPANEELELPIPDPHLWSPDDPFLYDLEVELRRADGTDQVQEAGGGKPLDTVESYFGMRSLGKREVDGVSRPTINGEPMFQIGTLDSGQWPDGAYTAPTDEALRFNLEAQKKLGYNMLRKHGKVETRRWFYHADQLGMLVWQDMPWMEETFDTPRRSEAELEHFKKEFEQVIVEQRNHPSMAVWTAINEGWGVDNQHLDFFRELAAFVADLDPERLVNANSGHDIGSNQDSGAGDFNDVHQYGVPRVDAPEPDPDRISALGEYTSSSIQFPEHTWGEAGGNIEPETFVDEYLETVEEIADLMVGRGLSASVYTATTDLENVVNGHITYDRKLIKATRAENGLKRIRDAHDAIVDQSRLVMENVSIDVESPDTYDSGELLGAPQPFEVTATVRNPETGASATAIDRVATTLTGLPDEWTVSNDPVTEFTSVGDGEAVTTTWEVTPDSIADGDISFDVTVEYEIGGNTYQYEERESVGPAQLAYWRFENSPADSSSNDNAISPQNGASFDDAPSVEGEYSLSLDGVDDHAMISDFGDGGILHDRFDRRTVSMWVKPDSTDGLQELYNEGGTLNGLAIRINDGTLEAVVAKDKNPVTIGGPFERTDWTHVAVVFDRGAFRIYVDGEELVSNPDVGFDHVPSHVAGSQLGSASLSDPWNDGDSFFAGHIDAAAVYRSALSVDQIRAVGTRSFSVDAPRLYTTGTDPQPLTVDATFSDLREDGTTFENVSMTVTDLPDGWTSTAQTTTDFGDLADGESVSATWEVTPDPSTTSSVELEVAVDYESAGEQHRLLDGATIDSLSSAALAQWQFNGTTEDTSGNGHAATLKNGASYDDQVVVEGSHSVDLTGADDYVDLAEGGEPFLSRSFSRRTLSMWVKPTSTSGDQVLYNQGAAFNGMAVRIHDGTLQAATVSYGNRATVSAPFAHTDWTHVAVVFDRGTLRLYVNGTEVAADEDVGYASVGGGYWGGELGTSEVSFWSGNFDGHVDETAIYPIALDADLVGALSGSY